ncbi:hypothetical protein KSF78_0008429 [Schistosoma japonicum]|nr:hypothetical protein KSF78_0008429 [Schistosoma japonicum]
MKTTLNLRPEVKQINCERHGKHYGQYEKKKSEIQFYFEVIYLSLYFHYTEFSTKALQNLKQCTGSLKVYFNDRNKLDSMIYRPRSIIYVINYSAMKFNILTDTLRGLVKLANDQYA